MIFALNLGEQGGKGNVAAVTEDSTGRGRKQINSIIHIRNIVRFLFFHCVTFSFCLLKVARFPACRLALFLLIIGSWSDSSSPLHELFSPVNGRKVFFC